MKNHIKSVLALTLICVAVAALLAATNYVTEPIIKANDEKAANEALSIVLPDGSGFEKLEIADKELPESVIEAYTEQGGGHVIKLSVAGFSPNMVIMCGIDAEGSVSGAICLSSEETLGYEKTYGESVVGSNISSIDAVDTIAGATKTTLAYRNAVRDALNAALVLSGGEAVKSEEEIFNENLSLALPAANGEFLSYFSSEVLEGVDRAYVALNGAGKVFVIGEYFVGVDADGNITSDVPEDAKNIAKAAYDKINNSSYTAIDISAYDLPSAITGVSKTDSGNYIFEAKASGFGINGDSWYNPSGEHIYIRVSITQEGEIISCETVSQKETDGYGSACGEAWFYTQFNGKDKSNYKEIDAIGGATLTTNGYKTAIMRVFEALEILKGDTVNE